MRNRRRRASCCGTARAACALSTTSYTGGAAVPGNLCRLSEIVGNGAGDWMEGGGDGLERE